MNFLQAQNVHVLWKTRLEKYLKNPEEADFDVNVAGDTSACELGHWLNENSDKLSSSEHFNSVVQLHDEFHILIQQVIDCQDDAEAETILKGQYEEVSHQLKINLSKLAKEFDYKIE